MHLKVNKGTICCLSVRVGVENVHGLRHGRVDGVGRWEEMNNHSAINRILKISYFCQLY